MKKYLVLMALLSLPAHATVIHDTNESPAGWSFNYAMTADLKSKIMFNLFVPKCQKGKEKQGCADDQREARTIANKQAAELDKKHVKKKKERIMKAPEKSTNEDLPGDFE